MYSSQPPPSSIPTDEEEQGRQFSSAPPSSPPIPGHAKERKAPSITPRRFTRFFTPRSNDSSVASSRRILFDLGSARNARGSPGQSSPLKPFSPAIGQENLPASFTRELKRRKVSHAAGVAGENVIADKGAFGVNIQPTVQGEDSRPLTADEVGNSLSPLEGQNLRYKEDGRIDDTFFLPKPVLVNIQKPISRYSTRGLHGSRLDWELGTGRRQDARPVSDWQDDTAPFYTKHADIHDSQSLERPGERCVPFCAEGNKDDTVVAVGDEEGYVRLLETNLATSPYDTMQGVISSFRAHTNAIIDLAWSGDGRRIATASGDQTGRIIDLQKEEPMAILAQHSASLKQIRFQPGNNSMLATSGRDGSVQIWDLRCKSSQGAVQNIHRPPGNHPLPPYYGCTVGDIPEAHHASLSLWGAPAKAMKEISVTALQFLPEGREHLLLTASNSNAAIKLWDIRCIRPSRSRGGGNVAVSETSQPLLHKGYRDFGISSINLSGDGSRLFTVCKDNTILAYSTAHLVMGNAPELSHNSSSRARAKETKAGLGPLYGYRHPDLNVGSFYVKSAIRPARNGKSELLAVGSSNGSAILIATDERHHEYQCERPEAEMRRLKPQKLAASAQLDGDGSANFPIYHNATNLVRGHEKEVGALTWTSDGNLVTVDDDCVVRCWREDAEMARDLRIGGEGEGRRWAAGWAEVCGDYDNQFY